MGPHRIGDLLLGLRLHPNDMAIQLIAIFVSTTLVWESLKDTLEECVGCTIWWPLARLKRRSGALIVDAAHVASMFEFSEHECENICTPLMQSTIISSSQPIESNEHDSNQKSTSTMAIPFVDGLFSNFQRRTYTTKRNGVLIYVVVGRTRAPR